MDVALPSGETVPAHDFFTRARARLTLDVPAALNDHAAQARRGDLDLDPVLWERAGVKATRPAAVLIPVVDRPEPMVLLTLRTELPSHPGQIAFPGGKIDPHDATPADAAMREADEEIGLARSLIPDRLSRSLSHLLRLSHPADAGPRRSGLPARAQCQRGRRRFRGAARLPDGARQSPAQVPRLEGNRAKLLRHAVRRALHLGRHRGNFAEFV
jgi:8-oxo-dGTP pyrophosphatase MutT (NUDIX family)